MTKNLKSAVVAAVIPSPDAIACGWTRADAYRALTEMIVEAHRYLDDNDRVLARIGDDVDQVLPADAVLESRGVDLEALAGGLSRGLNARVFMHGLDSGLDARLFCLALARNQLNLRALNRDLAGYGKDEVALINEGLWHLNELHREKQVHRTRAARMAHRHNLCSCVRVA